MQRYLQAVPKAQTINHQLNPWFMEEYKSFYQFLSKFIELKEEEFQQLIVPFLTTRQFPKKSFLTKRGEVENYLNFIVEGLVRKFYKKDKEEITIQISYEGQLIQVQESFHSRLPSEIALEAIESTRVLSITYDDLEKLYSQNAKMERLGRLIATFTILLRDKWQMQLIQEKPRERFLNFVERNPQLMQRVPQKFLASYLNIQPETFSRFKHLIRQQNNNQHGG